MTLCLLSGVLHWKQHHKHRRNGPHDVFKNSQERCEIYSLMCPFRHPFHHSFILVLPLVESQQTGAVVCGTNYCEKMHIKNKNMMWQIH